MNEGKPLALTIGEPSGIAGEITLKAWKAAQADPSIPPFMVIAHPAWLQTQAQGLTPGVMVKSVASAQEAAAAFREAVPVLPIALPACPVPGTLDKANAHAVIASIEQAVALTRAGETAAVVTNPIHKAGLYAAGFKFPGHTEYLAELCQSPPPVMMLAIEGLRVVPATVHLSLGEAVRAVTQDLIVSTARTVSAALKTDFGIPAPRLAVAALNPHAGEDGALGLQEIEIIAPAIAAVRAQGIGVVGPLPADTMFHPGARAKYDAAICMYHDQALIPLKTLDFAGGVNITLGLPIVRTSPDHGTALDIAGQGKADATSLINALRMAGEMARRRRAA